MTIDRLRAHYGFTRQPFGRDLAPAQLFTGRAHQEAVARLRWLTDEAAIGVITGEVGAGKTVAARAATAALDASRHTIVYLANPMVGARGIHHHIVTALGEVPKFHRPALIAQTADLLAAEHDERRKHVVLVVDEAHLLENEQLEQLRLVTNTDMDARSPLTLIMLGQPTLRRRLKLGHFAALDQRIGLRYHLPGLPLEETVAYVKHHLAIAGRSDPLFSDDAIALIHTTARGNPPSDQQPRRPSAHRRLRRRQRHHRPTRRQNRRHRSHQRLTHRPARRAPATAGAHPSPKPVLTEPVADILNQGVALHQPHMQGEVP